MNEYDDIIKMNRPISKHKHLDIDSRAAQFAPFAALSGYENAVKETARLTEKRIEIDEGLREVLNSKLFFLNSVIREKNEIIITYFVEDSKKTGGKYISKRGIIKKIDSVNEFIKFEDNTIILMKDIINITGDIFDI